jgi:hypothetical protein
MRSLDSHHSAWGSFFAPTYPKAGILHLWYSIHPSNRRARRHHDHAAHCIEPSTTAPPPLQPGYTLSPGGGAPDTPPTPLSDIRTRRLLPIRTDPHGDPGRQRRPSRQAAGRRQPGPARQARTNHATFHSSPRTRPRLTDHHHPRPHRSCARNPARDRLRAPPRPAAPLTRSLLHRVGRGDPESKPLRTRPVRFESNFT